MLKDHGGSETVVIVAEDTAFGEAIIGLVTEALAPVAGLEGKDLITYDVTTADLAPIFSEAQDSGAAFIYQISSANSHVMFSQ